MVIEFGEDNTNSRVLASSQVAGHNVRLVVEPLGAIITIALSSLFVPVLPYLLSFSAGAMLYVVVEELIPDMSEGEHGHIGPVFFAVGFTLMMVLDVALG